MANTVPALTASCTAMKVFSLYNAQLHSFLSLSYQEVAAGFLGQPTSLLAPTYIYLGPEDCAAAVNLSNEQHGLFHSSVSVLHIPLAVLPAFQPCDLGLMVQRLADKTLTHTQEHAHTNSLQLWVVYIPSQILSGC